MPFQTYYYVQETGALFSPKGSLMAQGYSGHDVGVNNPELQNSATIGPIPEGLWLMGTPSGVVSHLGPVAIPLEPAHGTLTLGRAGFFIHGDSTEDVMFHTKNSSHGCVILPRETREELAQGGCKNFTVIRSAASMPKGLSDG